MKIVIVGDRHVGGQGLAAGQLSFVGHFIRQINQTGRPVSVEAYAHSTLSAMTATLAQLPLEQYDLVIVQAGQGCMDHPAGLGALFVQPTDNYIDISGDLMLPNWLQPMAGTSARMGVARRLLSVYNLVCIKSLAKLGKLPRLHTVRQELTELLTVLRPHRHKAMLLTPFPHRELVRHWLRQQGRALFLRQDVRQVFSVFDSDSVIQPREEYFLDTDEGYLNAVGHELVGRALFDFYVAAPTIVSIHSPRRS